MALNYSTDALIRLVHGLPHYNRHFQRVDSQFAPHVSDYREALGMAGFPFYILCALTIVFMLLHMFLRACRRCCKGNQSRFKRVNKTWIALSTLLCVLIFAGCVLWSYIANQQVIDASGELKDTMSDLDAHRAFTVMSMEDIEDDYSSASVHAVGMLPTSDALEQSGLPNAHVVTDTLTTIISEANTTAHALAQSGAVLTTESLTDSIHRVNKYSKVRTIVQTGLFSFLCLPFLLFVIGGLCQSQRVMKNIAWLAFITGLLGWILTGVESSAAMATGDFCHGPSRYVKSEMNRTNEDPTLTQYVTYYLDCFPQSQNPLGPMADSADASITHSIEQVSIGAGFLANLTKQTIGQYNISTQVEDLLESYTAINGSLHAARAEALTLHSDLECVAPHNLYVSGLESVCRKGLKGIGYLVFTQLIISLLAIMLFSLAKSLALVFDPASRTRLLAAERIDEDEDYRPFEPANSGRQLTDTLLEDLSLDPLSARRSKTKR